MFQPSDCLWQVWGLILNMISPLLPSCGDSPLPLDVGYLFLVGSNTLLSMVVQQWVVILEFPQEKMSTLPPTLPSWYESHGMLYTLPLTMTTHTPFLCTKLFLIYFTLSISKEDVDMWLTLLWMVWKHIFPRHFCWISSNSPNSWCWFTKYSSITRF